jgi:hypothetical protein
VTDRRPYAPTFTRSHAEPEPNAVSFGRIFDGGRSRPGPQRRPATATGLARVQQIGGSDGLADVAAVAEVVEPSGEATADTDSRG